MKVHKKHSLFVTVHSSDRKCHSLFVTVHSFNRKLMQKKTDEMQGLFTHSETGQLQTFNGRSFNTMTATRGW